jgi:hypothetical protein
MEVVEKRIFFSCAETGATARKITNRAKIPLAILLIISLASLGGLRSESLVAAREETSKG